MLDLHIVFCHRNHGSGGMFSTHCRLFFFFLCFHRFYCRCTRMKDIVHGSVFIFLRFSVVPVLYRTIISGDSAVNFCFLATGRADKMFPCNIAVFFTYRIRRWQGIVRQTVIFCDLSYQCGCCLPVRKFLSQECMEDCTGCVQCL